jgi:uncharacterized protein YdeI (YjbR/CyaY-like superfamily)
MVLARGQEIGMAGGKMASGEKGKIEIPKELREALASDAAARAVFEKLPPSHRREYAGYVAEAKQASTRERRARKTLEMLHMIRPG